MRLFRLVAIGEFDEYVFEAGSERTNFGDNDAVVEQLLAEMIEVQVIIDQSVDGLSEDGGAAKAGNGACDAESLRDVGRRDFDAIGTGRIDLGKFAECRRR